MLWFRAADSAVRCAGSEQYGMAGKSDFSHINRKEQYGMAGKSDFSLVNRKALHYNGTR
jgi:hypothetical protein